VDDIDDIEHAAAEVEALEPAVAQEAHLLQWRPLCHGLDLSAQTLHLPRRHER
jgi:hypothetical protein